MSKKTGQTFVFGAVVLMASNILVKLIGALFRIPLTNIIKVEGMGYFNAAYSIYVMFYNISTAGIPVAVSRMVAASASKGNYKEAQKIFDIALKLFVVIGVVGTAVMMAGAQFFCRVVENARFKLCNARNSADNILYLRFKRIQRIFSGYVGYGAYRRLAGNRGCR